MLIQLLLLQKHAWGHNLSFKSKKWLKGERCGPQASARTGARFSVYRNMQSIILTQLLLLQKHAWGYDG